MRPFTALLILHVLVSPLAWGAPPQTEEQKTFYAIGLALGQNAAPFELTPAELAYVQQGFADAALGKPPVVQVQQYIGRIQELQKSRGQTAAQRESQSGDAYLAKTTQEKGATKTASGLIIQTIRPGTGPAPKPTDTVKVHYHGTLINGKVFDSSVQRGEPATFPLNGVIPCWTEGLQLMKVGGKSRLTCPANLAYGDRGAPPDIKPGSTLVFEVELLEIGK